jgi:hypothetical protein
MAKLDRLVNGIIIASDKHGRNKVRFCDNVKLRTYLLKKQGFTIHDIVTSPEPVSRTEMLRLALDHEFDHDDSEHLVKNLLFKYDQKVLDEHLKQDLLREIANRPRRDTDITAQELDNILKQL